MNRRKFVVSGVFFPMLSGMKAAYAWNITVIEFAKLIIAAIVGAVATKLTETVVEGDANCTSTTKYSFDGENCIQCQACVSYLESGMIAAAMDECPTGSIKIIEVSVSCPR